MTGPASQPPAQPPAQPEPLLELAAVMRRLRVECPWKAAQTHRSLARYLLEETHETLEAIDALPAGGAPAGSTDHLREELGDLLLQVYFHAVIAEQTGAFTLDDVARGITEKLYRRNPHVFGPEADADADAAPGGPEATPEAVNDAWQAIKAREKARTSVTEGLPPGLPALLLADKVLDRLARAGSPAVPAAARRVGSAGTGDEQQRDLGDRLLDLVAEAHEDGTDPEQALRDAVRRLLTRAGEA